MAILRRVIAAGFTLLAGTASADARSPACERVMASFDALERANDWSGQTRAGHDEPLLSRKTAGRLQYQLPGVGNWVDLPESAIAAGRSMVADIRANPDAISGCEIAGTDRIEGIPVTVIRARIAPGTVPAYAATLYLGVDDRPYRMVSDEIQVDYRYGGE
jgi:hypothetical protein